jgi:hypothetical protein
VVELQELETFQQGSERLRRENQSHMARICHLENEVRNTTVNRLIPVGFIYIIHYIILNNSSGILTKICLYTEYIKININLVLAYFFFWQLRQKVVELQELETFQQGSERLRRENQLHMATIRHLENQVRNTCGLYSI